MDVSQGRVLLGSAGDPGPWRVPLHVWQAGTGSITPVGSGSRERKLPHAHPEVWPGRMPWFPHTALHPPFKSERLLLSTLRTPTANIGSTGLSPPHSLQRPRNHGSFIHDGVHLSCALDCGAHRYPSTGYFPQSFQPRCLLLGQSVGWRHPCPAHSSSSPHLSTPPRWVTVACTLLPLLHCRTWGKLLLPNSQVWRAFPSLRVPRQPRHT